MAIHPASSINDSLKKEGTFLNTPTWLPAKPHSICSEGHKFQMIFICRFRFPPFRCFYLSPNFRGFFWRWANLSFFFFPSLVINPFYSRNLVPFCSICRIYSQLHKINSVFFPTCPWIFWKSVHPSRHSFAHCFCSFLRQEKLTHSH